MHFYTRTKNGIEPRHFVPMKSDPSRTRASRVSDAKSALKNGEQWFPSVTTVLNVLDKPGLNNWRVDEHLKSAFDIHVDSYNKDSGWKSEGFIKHAKYVTQKRMDEAPKAGTDIHKVLELYFTGGATPEGKDLEICENVSKALSKHCGHQAWEYEKYFVDAECGYAGCADLISKEWVIDYKSKQTTDKFKPGKMAYPEHTRQLAAYDCGMPTDTISSPSGMRRAANIFICLETAEIDFHEHKADKLDDGYMDFLDCLSIYQRNTFNPLGE